MATQNSRTKDTPGNGFPLRFQPALFAALLALCSALGEVSSAHGGLAEAEARLQSARSAWTTNRFNLELSWKLAEACFDRAEFATSNRERATLADEGIAVAREVVRRSSNSAPGHFYLAMNLGQLARTRTFSALGLVSEMERHFLAAVQNDPGFRFAGPERSLGMLYAEAPGWPTSIGSRSKARSHLQRAVELAPDYPENLLALLEAEWEFGERKRVSSRLPDLAATFERAKGPLAGKQYEEDWADWNRRAEKLRKQASTPELIPQGGVHSGDRAR